jgi:protein-tyrosine kinase
MASNPLTPTRGRIEPVRRRIGELLSASGDLTDQEVLRVVAHQAKTAMRFGEAAVALGLVTEEDVQHALAQQFNYPYLRRGDSNLSPMLTSAYQPFGGCAEAFRVLRSELMLRWFDRGQKALAVTSPRAGAGSSTLAANLAVSFAQLGERTLLIDANFRRPVQHGLFGVIADVGLVDVLVGHVPLEEAVVSIVLLNGLGVLCAGPIPPNPHELLSGRQLKGLLDQAQRNYDVVILDAPAALECTDVQMIGARAGGYVLVTRRHQTRLADVRATAARLAPTGAVALGAVVND